MRRTLCLRVFTLLLIWLTAGSTLSAQQAITPADTDAQSAEQKQTGETESGEAESQPKAEAAATDSKEADSKEAEPEETETGLSVAAVEATLSSINGDEQVSASVKAAYQQAIDALKSADGYAAKGKSFEKDVAQAPQTLERLRAELNQLTSAATDEDPADLPDDTAELQKWVNEDQSTTTKLSDELSKTTSDLTRVKGRPIEISERLPSIQRELSEVRKELASAEAAVDSRSDATAQQTLGRATELRLVAEQEMLQLEQQTLATREELLVARQALLKKQVELITARLKRRQVALNKRLTEEAKQVAETLPDLPEDKESQALGEEVRLLAADFRFVVECSKRVSEKPLQLEQRLDNLTEQFDSVKQQLAFGGGRPAMAQVLIELNDLARIDAAEFALPAIWLDGERYSAPSLDQSQLRSFQLIDQARKHPELVEKFEGRDSDALKQTLEKRVELLEKLKLQYDRLTGALSLLESNKGQLLNKAAEVRRYVKEQLFGFGVRTCPRISLSSFTKLPAGLAWTFAATQWEPISNGLMRIWTRNLILTVLVIFVALVILIARRAIVNRIRELGMMIRRISTDRFAYTVRALFLTTVISLPFPLLFGYLAWSLGRIAENDDFVRGMSEGLWPATWFVMMTGFICSMCISGGLGQNHFGIGSEYLSLIRSGVFRLAVVYIPTMTIANSFSYGQSAEYLGSVSRVVLISGHIWAAAVIWRMFSGADGILSLLKRDAGDRVAARWRYLWYWPLAAMPIILIIIACEGYLVTAYRLSISLVWTGGILLVGEIAYLLALRWFSIKQRRIAFAEALERRKARLEAEDTEGGDSESEVVSVDEQIDEGELDLESISGQTISLLRLTFGLATLIPVLWFWTTILPFDDLLERITVPVAGITLLSLLQATLVATVTFLVAKNLPGLLELAVLRSTNLDTGARNAITTLCQYGLVAFGGAVLFNLLQLDWSKFGWVAAALSVGLGFGLQEVVGNFVCGVILLFEQPIRVGDVVTLDGTTGTVTKIHLRATTIRNWDRQDLVVPNKNLITGTILNWTLSASVNRLVIPVGVAYGCDTERAREILLEVAQEHPLIMEDPAPIASVENFGDSCINLMLRAYLPDLSARISTTTEIHTEISRRYEAAGIEIPFPQRDINIRGDLNAIQPSESGEGGQASWSK